MPGLQMGKKSECSMMKDTGGEEGKERGNWDNPCDFFLSCLGYAVGLGNVWRFPYLCYKHGGVTFLIAYLTMLLISGLPLFFLELSLGQYAGISPLKVFPRLAPLAAGLGWGMLMITFLVVIYYNLIIAWTIYYTFAGFAATLPWARCGEDDLTSRDCYQKDQEAECFSASPASTFWKKKCSPVSELCENFGLWVSSRRDHRSSSLMCYNGSHHFTLNEVVITTPSDSP